VSYKTLYRLWLGPYPMPEQYKWYGALWRELNPDMEVIDFSWHNLPENLPCRDVMDDLRSKATSGHSVELATQLADVIGYYLTSLGGIYSNADIRPVRPIPDYMWGTDFATYEEINYPLVVNAFTGGCQYSSFWRFLLAGLSQNYFDKPSDAEMVFTTGPHYLTSKIKEWDRGITVYPHHTVNPILWKEVGEGQRGSDLLDLDTLPAGCIGVHDWGHKMTGRSNVVH